MEPLVVPTLRFFRKCVVFHHRLVVELCIYQARERGSRKVTVYAGADIGSATAKVIILSDGSVAGSALVPMKVNSEKAGLQALEMALHQTKLSREDIKFTVATGYGRFVAPFADATVTEITCHAAGAYYWNPQVRTVIDVGGQDCKVIRMGEMGQVVEFAMNDKCAAGTGRFFEVLARIFDVGLDDLGAISLKADARLSISSTCTVFAESEVASLMARGEKPENIIGGVHYAFGRRIEGLLRRVGLEKELTMTGGVGKNIGMRKIFEELLEVPVAELKGDPQFAGALGAALIARRKGAQL